MDKMTELIKSIVKPPMWLWLTDEQKDLIRSADTVYLVTQDGFFEHTGDFKSDCTYIVDVYVFDPKTRHYWIMRRTDPFREGYKYSVKQPLRSVDVKITNDGRYLKSSTEDGHLMTAVNITSKTIGWKHKNGKVYDSVIVYLLGDRRVFEWNESVIVSRAVARVERDI